MGSEAKWIEGWFTKPGWFWCELNWADRPEVQLAMVFDDLSSGVVPLGGYICPKDVTHWLDAEIVPPAPPREPDQDRTEEK